MPKDPTPAPACSAQSSETDDAPLCPTRRWVLERALALGALPLLAGVADAAAARWTNAGAVKNFALNRPRKVNLSGGQVPVFVIRTGTNRFVCFSAICTHQGTVINWSATHPTYFECPNHGSKFARTTGAVTRGPAKRALPRLPVRVLSGKVQVDISSAV